MSETKKLTVLYVDENEILLRASAISLENSGFDVIRCIGLNEAKKAFAEKRVDVVLAEVNLDNGKHSPEVDRFLLDCAAKGAGIVVLTGNILYAPPKEIRQETPLFRKPTAMIYVSRGIRRAYEQAEARKESGNQIVLDPQAPQVHDYSMEEMRRQANINYAALMREISSRNIERRGKAMPCGVVKDKARIR